MAYTSVTYSKPANYIAGTLNPGLTSGSSGSITLDSLQQVELTFWSGSGSQVGLINLLNVKSGTLTSATPGTTDTVDIDLSAFADDFGASKSFAEVCTLDVLNFSTTDGVNLVIGGASGAAATNPWVAPFADMATPTLGRLRVLPGYVHPANTRNVAGGASLWGGNLASFPVSGTSKVLRLYTASASLAYRVIVTGRDAAS